MKYVIKDAKGTPIQWVNDATINELPKGAIELTDEEWDNRTGVPLVKSKEQLAAEKAEADARESAKQALLSKLGISEEELKVLFS